MSSFDSGRPSTFACEVERAGDEVVARLRGELDMVTTMQAQAILEGAVQGGNGERLVIDLRELTFMDSSGLRLLLKWDAAARDDGFSVAIVPGPDHVQRLFELTGLENHFTYAEPS